MASWICARRERIAPTVLLLVCLTGAGSAACGALLGVSAGIPEDDASADAASGKEGGHGDDGDAIAMTRGDSAEGGDATSREGGDACVSDPAWCTNHCGTGPDNCGVTSTCQGCPMGDVCNTQNQCACQPQSSWCNGRCGKTKDNCNNDLDCGGCDGGTCMAGACGCTPETVAAACGSRGCGQTTNNCSQTVNCGDQGSSNCPTNQVCLTNDTCCTPNNATVCGNQCGVTVTNSCGQSVQCLTSVCPNGETCYQNQCCTPNNAACANRCGGVTVTNNCGQQVQCIGACGGGQECSPSTSTCCTPTSGCGTSCNVSAPDTCGVSQPCSCQSGQVCSSGNTCCTPSGCSGPCANNCGQPDARCCPDAGADGGYCLGPGTACTPPSSPPLLPWVQLPARDRACGGGDLGVWLGCQHRVRQLRDRAARRNHAEHVLPMTRDSNPQPTPSMPFPPGSVLAGKYRVDRLLGEGGMGWVVLATHLQLDQRVALKFMRANHAAGSPDAVARFIREARAAARIQSEHVARVADVGTLDDGSPYLVMEFLEGRDLDSLLHERGALPVDLAIDYAMQACEGLAEAHAAGIIHRDLKPANLFLARRSDGSVRVKLLDFGISKLASAVGPGAVSEASMTNTQTLMGSPLYMAPEQMRSTKSVDRRADIWSMGVIVYEMLTGRAPFDAHTLPEICARILADPPAALREARSEIPTALEAVVMRCLEKDVDRRFADVAALAQALSAFGGPDARTAASRIARVLRVVAPFPASDLIPSRQTTNGTAPSASVAAQTAAAFGTSARTNKARRTALPLLAGGALAVTAAVWIGMVATGARHSDAKAPAASANSVESAGPPTPAPAPAPSLTLAPSPPPDLTPPSPTPTSTSTPSAHVLSPPAHKPKPAASTTARPSATSGFGGRD